MTPQPRVACIVVNWNNAPDTLDCLAALARQDYPQLSVLVVDNASTDGSLAILQAAHPSATYLPNPENAGFPKACNLAARHPLAQAADFLWLLNNDTVPPPDTLRKLVATALAHPRNGVIGSVLYYQHDPQTVQAWGGGHISRWTAYNTHFHTPTAFKTGTYLTFASALIRQPLFAALDGLYEGAFMYFEDADFCLRAQAAGWLLAVAPDTAVLHKEGGTAKPSSPNMIRTVTCAGLLFLRRHSPLPPVSYAIYLTLRLGKRILRADLPAARAVLAGLRIFLKPKK